MVPISNQRPEVGPDTPTHFIDLPLSQTVFIESIVQSKGPEVYRDGQLHIVLQTVSRGTRPVVFPSCPCFKTITRLKQLYQS